jgi:excisionase family DNA binding protein
MVSAQQPDSSCGTSTPLERTRAETVAPLLSVAAAARRLGVSRWTIWRMIADGELDAETVTQGGRVITRVRLPEPPPDNAAAPPRSRTAQLQEQVDRLTKTLERLTALLQEANRDRAALQEALRQRRGEVDSGPTEAGAPRGAATAHLPERSVPVAVPPGTPPGLGRILGGLRPNPMTHPASELPRSRPMRREELLEPVRELFRARRRTWWQRIPLLSRG